VEVNVVIRLDYVLISTIAVAALVLGTPGCARRNAVAPAAPAEAPPVAAAPEEPVPVEPAPVPVAPPDMAPAFFEFDSHLIGDAGREALDQLAKLMREHSEFAVTIEGHCDERGPTEYNLALGERRALAARDYLVMSGVTGERIQIMSLGEERPFDFGHDEAAWAKNRRAHFVVKQATLVGGVSN
jgi:peptidoglycan-associated lipoprotein